MSNVIPARPEPANSAGRFSQATWQKISILLALAVAVSWYFGAGTSSNPNSSRATMAANVPERSESKDEQAVETKQAPTDDEQRKLIVGKWETDRNGRRELTVKEDGTATMDVTINNTIARMLLGERIKLFLEWKIEHGELTMITTGGEPEGKVSLMTSMYGKERKQKIIELNDTTLHHPDDDPAGEDHIWKRIEN